MYSLKLHNLFYYIDCKWVGVVGREWWDGGGRDWERREGGEGMRE